MNTWLIILIAIIIVGIIGRILYNPIRKWRWSSVKGVTNLNNLQFQEELKNTEGKYLLDVRELSEVQQGYIPGMVHIPVGQLSKRVAEVPKDQKILIYCRGGVRSGKAGKILLDNGFNDIAHLTGGINAWTGSVVK